MGNPVGTQQRPWEHAVAVAHLRFEPAPFLVRMAKERLDQLVLETDDMRLELLAPTRLEGDRAEALALERMRASRQRVRLAAQRTELSKRGHRAFEHRLRGVLVRVGKPDPGADACPNRPSLAVVRDRFRLGSAIVSDVIVPPAVFFLLPQHERQVNGRELEQLSAIRLAYFGSGHVPQPFGDRPERTRIIVRRITFASAGRAPERMLDQPRIVRHSPQMGKRGRMAPPLGVI